MGKDPKEDKHVIWPKISLPGHTAECYRADGRGGRLIFHWKWEKSKTFLPPLKSHHVNGTYSVHGKDCVTLGK